MANLVQNHLASLAEVGATRRARSTRLAPLVIREIDSTSAELPGPVDDESVGPAMSSIQELRVGPFRGFTRNEAFDLSRPISLIYGANGTGKSSFCEALEYALLGTISEAQAKRLDHSTYCANAWSGEYATPVIVATAGAGPPSQIASNEELYRFCFIEKNRIEDFARIAARTPSDQRQLIATLFGVDRFASFVRGFNPTLDNELDLEGVKTQELAQKRTILSSAELSINESDAKLAAIAQDETVLASRINAGSSYPDVAEWLLGSDIKQGRLEYVQQCLDAPAQIVYGVSANTLEELLVNPFRTHTVLSAAEAELSKRAGEVSYKQLYESVLQLADVNLVNCPACGTDLALVAQNPYDRATIGLAQLDELTRLQQQVVDQREELRVAMQDLYTEMSRAVTVLNEVQPVQLRDANLPALPQSSNGEWLRPWMDEDRLAWTSLLALCSAVEAVDRQSREISEQRQLLVDERIRLDGFRLEIEQCRTRRSTIESDLLLARQTVTQFEDTNRALIAEAVAELPLVQRNIRIKQAYDAYILELKEYLDLLPARLIRGLGQRARDLYNQFNRDDHASDLLYELRLPMAENEKIELEYQGAPGVRHDALVVLSEGHIRCLGLSILLAKNILENCPVVIFDDVVNAIDDNHRNGIWRTFFEENNLENKQVILTSHAEEFLHRIQQELGASRAGDIKLFKFLPHLGDHDLRVDTSPPTKNYVILARQSLDSAEKRDALRYSRPALESLTDRVWTWLGRRGDGRLELKLAGPRSPWELNNKCSKLRIALRPLENSVASLNSIVRGLDALLGVNGGSIEWGYLNSGTHDSQRDGEFDEATVRTIVEAIELLDRGLEEMRNSR